METLAFVLSTLGTICICISSLIKGKNIKLILLLVFLTNVLVAASYFLLGAFNGAASSCVSAVQTIINYFFRRKGKPIPLWLIAIYAAAFIIVNLTVLTHIVDIIPLLATLVFVLEISQKNGKRFRLLKCLNAVLWIIYDCITLSFGPLSTHAIQLASTLLGMVMHDKTKKTVKNTA